jgi:phage baseplate assembly protein W
VDRKIRDREYIGQGLTFPLQISQQGGFTLAHGVNDIEQAVRIILSTSPGERVMRPEFGCRVHELVFAPNNAATRRLLAFYVEEALIRWEPRISVHEITTTTDTTRDGTLLVEIKYEIKDTHDEHSIVYPFFLQGDEPGND